MNEKLLSSGFGWISILDCIYICIYHFFSRYVSEYKKKLYSFQEDAEQLEGFQTQEMAKVKHLVRDIKIIMYIRKIDYDFLFLFYILLFYIHPVYIDVHIFLTKFCILLKKLGHWVLQ